MFWPRPHLLTSWSQLINSIFLCVNNNVTHSHSHSHSHSRSHSHSHSPCSLALSKSTRKHTHTHTTTQRYHTHTRKHNDTTHTHEYTTMCGYGRACVRACVCVRVCLSGVRCVCFVSFAGLLSLLCVRCVGVFRTLSVQTLTLCLLQREGFGASS